MKRVRRVGQLTPSRRVQIAGQLVPQSPADEPASVLLERIQRRKRSKNMDAVIGVAEARTL